MAAPRAPRGLVTAKVRLTFDELAAIKRNAKANERSVAAEIRYVLRDYLNHRPADA